MAGGSGEAEAFAAGILGRRGDLVDERPLDVILAQLTRLPRPLPGARTAASSVDATPDSTRRPANPDCRLHD